MPEPSRHLDDGFMLGAWRVEPLRNRLLPPGGGDAVDMEPRVMKVLVALAREAPSVMTRDALMEQVWTDVVVTDDALTRCISGIRKAFGDDRIIETVPRVGYALTRQPSPVQPVVRSTGGRVVRILIPSLVVLLIVATAFILGSIVVQQKPLDAARPTPLGAMSGMESWPAWSPEGQRIAFVHADVTGAAGELYVMRPGDTDPLQLTRLGGQVRSPVWDAPSDRIVFLFRDDDGCRVLSVPSLGGPAQEETTCVQPLGGLALSPDGHLMVISQPAEDGGMVRLHLVDRTSGAAQVIPNDDAESSDYMPAFSPDGDRIVFARTMGEGHADAFEYNLYTGRVSRMTRGLNSLAGVDWLPDASALVVSEREGLEFLLWRVDLRTKERTYLGAQGMQPRARRTDGAVVYTHSESDTDIVTEAGTVCSSSRNDRQPVWRPGMGDLAFISDRDGTPGVYACDPASGRVQALLTGSRAPDLVNGLAAGPDGRLAFAALSGSYIKLFVLDRDAGTPRMVTTGRGNDLYPAWSPDGAWIYFGSDRSGAYRLWRIPVSGGDAEQVADIPAIRARVAPDGSVYAIASDGEAIRRLDASGPGEVVFEPESGVGSIALWDVDAQGLMVGSALPGSGRLVRVDPRTGTSTDVAQLDPERAHGSVALAPDGRWAITSLRRQESDLVVLQ